MRSPLAKTYRTTSEYGWRTLSGVRQMHYGIDLVCADGTQGVDLVSTVDGTVTDLRNTVPDSHTGLGITLQVVGNYIYITTADGYQVMYRHLRCGSIPADIKKGTKVKVGDKIGRMGRTGQATSTADHLHWELRGPDGAAFDPKPYLDNDKTFAKTTGQLQPAVAQTAAAGVFKEDNKVKVLSAVNYDTGGAFKLYYPEYEVIQVKGSRVVIGIKGVVTAAVDAKYLAKV